MNESEIDDAIKELVLSTREGFFSLMNRNLDKRDHILISMVIRLNQISLVPLAVALLNSGDNEVSAREYIQDIILKTIDTSLSGALDVLRNKHIK